MDNITILCKVEEKESSTTVAELIRALSHVPSDAIIQTEGCDCWGDAIGIVYDAKSNEVLICREIFDRPTIDITPDEPEQTVVANEPLILLPEPKNLGDLE